jgi:hypothetical protein
MSAAFGAAACASLGPPPEGGNDLPAVVRGDTIIVHLRWPGDDPLPTAERYCASLGRWPQPRTVTAYTVSYDCAGDASPVPAAPAAPADSRRNSRQ